MELGKLDCSSFRAACLSYVLSHLQGKDAIPFLETLVVGDVAGLKSGTGSLSVITNEKGGIIDDTVVTKVNDSHIYLVVNAGCREKDLGTMLCCTRLDVCVTYTGQHPS